MSAGATMGLSPERVADFLGELRAGRVFAVRRYWPLPGSLAGGDPDRKAFEPFALSWDDWTLRHDAADGYVHEWREEVPCPDERGTAYEYRRRALTEAEARNLLARHGHEAMFACLQ